MMIWCLASIECVFRTPPDVRILKHLRCLEVCINHQNVCSFPQILYLYRFMRHKGMIFSKNALYCVIGSMIKSMVVSYVLQPHTRTLRMFNMCQRPASDNASLMRFIVIALHAQRKQTAVPSYNHEIECSVQSGLRESQSLVSLINQSIYLGMNTHFGDLYSSRKAEMFRNQCTGQSQLFRFH